MGVVVNFGCQFDWIWNKLRPSSLGQFARTFPGRINWGKDPPPWQPDVSKQGCGSPWRLAGACPILLPAPSLHHYPLL